MQQKGQEFLNGVNRKEVTLYFFRETYSTVDTEEKWKSEWGGHGVFSHGTNHSKGVAVMFGEDLDVKIDNLLVDKEGRYIFIKGQVQGEKNHFGKCLFSYKR